MKRQLSPPNTATLCESRAIPQKRCRTNRSSEVSQRCAISLCAPHTPESNAVDNEQEQQQGQPSQQCIGAQYVRDWVDEVARSGNMSDSASVRQRRAHKASVRGRSSSPTKRSPKYRKITMTGAHVYIDQMDPPTDVDELCRRIIGDSYDNARELSGVPVELKEQVRNTASDYLDRCKELARDAKGEAEWKARCSRVFLGHSSSFLVRICLRQVHRTSRGERS